VAQLLGQLQAEGFHTALETNGTHPRLPELFPLVDALILDVKHHDDAVLRRVTGVGDAVLRRNLARACAGHGDLRVRIPVVHGFNDAPGDAERFADAFAALPTDRATFECLPFHEYGKIKWAQCGLPYRWGRDYVCFHPIEYEEFPGIHRQTPSKPPAALFLLYRVRQRRSTPLHSRNHG